MRIRRKHDARRNAIPKLAKGSSADGNLKLNSFYFPKTELAPMDDEQRAEIIAKFLRAVSER